MWWCCVLCDSVVCGSFVYCEWWWCVWECSALCMCNDVVCGSVWCCVWCMCAMVLVLCVMVFCVIYCIWNPQKRCWNKNQWFWSLTGQRCDQLQILQDLDFWGTKWHPLWSAEEREEEVWEIFWRQWGADVQENRVSPERRWRWAPAGSQAAAGF